MSSFGTQKLKENFWEFLHSTMSNGQVGKSSYRYTGTI